MVHRGEEWCTWPSAVRQKLTTAKDSDEAAAVASEARKLASVLCPVGWGRCSSTAAPLAAAICVNPCSDTPSRRTCRKEGCGGEGEHTGCVG